MPGGQVLSGHSVQPCLPGGGDSSAPFLKPVSSLYHLLSQIGTGMALFPPVQGQEYQLHQVGGFTGGHGLPNFRQALAAITRGKVERVAKSIMIGS